MKSRVVFADKQLKDAFDKLENSKTEDKDVYCSEPRTLRSFVNHKVVHVKSNL